MMTIRRRTTAATPRRGCDPLLPAPWARGLTDAVIATLTAAAPLWRRLNLRPDVVLSSPLPRARRTAELFCDAVGGSPLTDDRLRPGASWGEMARAMSAHPDARRVLFV